MGAPASLSYWPADTSQPVLELTTGDLLRQAAGDARTHTALIEAAPPGTPSLAGAQHTGRRWTYGELLAEAEQCAHRLLTEFSPGERITIWAPNIPEWVILQFGAALAGLVVVTANPALRAAELRYVLEQSRSAGLFHTAAFRGSDMAAIAREATAGLPGLRAAFCFTDWPATAGIHCGGGSLPVVRPGAASDLLVESAIAGLGVVNFFEDGLKTLIEQGALEPVLKPWWQSFSGPFLYFPSRRLLPAPLRAFVDFIKNDRLPSFDQ